MSPTQVSGIIVTVPDAAKIESVTSKINQIAPDLKVRSAEDIRTATIVNVMTANNMGMSFATLVLFGIISGFFIIGLTMYSVTYDRIKDYGTLKAIGGFRRIHNPSGNHTVSYLCHNRLFCLSRIINT